MNLRLLFPLLFVFALTACNEEYTVTDLGTLGGPNSSAYGINESGDIVGLAYINDDDYHAFLYRDGVMTDLGTLQLNSVAKAVNSAGRIVGGTNEPYSQPFFYSDGVMTDVNDFADFGADSLVRSANDINDNGELVGGLALPEPHAYLYSYGASIDLGTLGGSMSKASGINNSGEVTGYANTLDDNGNEGRHAFLYSNGVMQDLGTLGGEYSRGEAINDSGQVVGQADTAAEVSHAFVYDNGVMIDLGTLGADNARSDAWDINTAGVVVGTSELLPRTLCLPRPYCDTYAFKYSDGAMQDLNDLIDAESGWELVVARGINDAGQIVGEGRLNCELRAFLLTPIP